MTHALWRRSWSADRPRLGVWLRLCWPVLLAWAGLQCAPVQAQSAASASAPALATASAATAHHFRALSGESPLTLGRPVLTDEERAFIAALPEIRVGVARQGFPPFEVVAADGEISGIHVDMLAHLARAFGLKIRPVVFDNWSGVLEAARQRQVDVLMSVGITAERAAFLEFTLGTTPASSALFARKGSGAATPPPEQARLAIERGYLANTYAVRLFPQARIVNFESTDDALRAVAQAQADYYVGSLLPGVAALSRLGLVDVEVNRLLSYGSGHYHFAVRKDWAPLAMLLSRGVSVLRAAPTALWQQALASLPPNLAPLSPKPLSQAQAALLVERPVWRLGVVRGLTPLDQVDDRGLHSGIGAEFAEAVARRLGVGLQVLPFATAAARREALLGNRIDLVPFSALSPAQRVPQSAPQPATEPPAQDAAPASSMAYFDMAQVLVARHDAPLYWDLSSLRGQRLALAAEHPLRGLIEQRFPLVRILEVADDGAAMDAVADGLADATLQIKLQANQRIHADNDGVLRVVAELDDLRAAYGFAASPAAAALIPLIDEVLAEIAPAEQQRMQQRWLAQEPAPAFAWRRYLPAALIGLAALLALALATAAWMRRLQREIEARRQSEQALRDISASLPCVAFRTVFDARGEVRGNHYSPSAQAVLGRPLDPAQTLLHNLRGGLSGADLQAADGLAAWQLKTGERAQMTARYEHPDGRARWLHGESVRQPARREIGEPVGGSTLTGYLADVTHEHALQAQLVQAEHARQQWLVNASDELREPVDQIAQALQLMATGDSGHRPASGSNQHRFSANPTPLPGARAPASHLGVARDALRALSQLLDDVHAAARLDQGQLTLRPQAVEVAGLVAELDAALRTWTAHKALAWHCTLAADVPAVLWLDPMRVRQVAINLLSNAVKYTAAGSIRLDLSLDSTRSTASTTASASACAAPAVLLISVTDTGVGIDNQRLDRLFTPYASTHTAAVVAEGSTGLGLSVCRRLVDLMGGSIELHSTPGQGTRAEVRLPLPDLAAAEAALSAAATAAVTAAVTAEAAAAVDAPMPSADQAQP